MQTMDWVCLGLTPFAVTACFIAYKVAKKQRKHHDPAYHTFGPMCKCGHRVSMHVPAHPRYGVQSGTWCRALGCPCYDYKEATP